MARVESAESQCSWIAHGLHGVLTECSWSAHGLRGLHGPHVECSSTAHRLHVDCREYSHGVLIDCSWTAHGLLILLMECSWSAHGVNEHCSWSPWEGVGECKVLDPCYTLTEMVHGRHHESWGEIGIVSIYSIVKPRDHCIAQY